MSQLQSNMDASSSQRVINACRRCRQRKVKCSGTQPCTNCKRRGQSCIFDEPSRRVVISERHLQELQMQASRAHDSHNRNVVRGFSQPATNASAEQYSESSQGNVSERQSIWPHTSSQADPPQTAVNTSSLVAVDLQDPDPSQGAEFRPTVSTWAFCRAARLALLQESHQGVQSVQESRKLTYQASRQTAPAPHSAMTTLPPKSYIIHLAQVCDFRLNTSHYCFNLLTFQQRLDRIDLASFGTTSGAFFAEILAILAFGKLSLEKGASALGPPGIHEFQRAASVWQNMTTLSQDPIAAIETLLLLSMYSQAADMHHVAYLYTGQAASLSRSFGLPKRARTSVDSAALDSAIAQRVWWTIRLLEQKQALTIGAESEFLFYGHAKHTSHADDVDEHADRSLLHTHLCIAHLMTRVTSVLTTDLQGSCTNDALVNKISTQLEAAQDLGRLLSSSHRLCEGQDFTTISRPMATLYLAYYRAVLHATKPFLIDVVSQTFSATPLSESVVQILKTCVKAAAYSLNIIHVLHEQGLLETFNFEDLEATFTSGLTLILANGVFPRTIDNLFLAIARNALQDMSNRGNLPADALLQEMNAIKDIVNNASSIRRASHPPSLRLSLHLSHSGQALNDCIVDVLEAETPLTEIFDLDRPQTQDHTLSGIGEAQQPSVEMETFQHLTSVPDLNPMNHTPVENEGICQAPEFYLDNFDDFQVQFDLDMMRPGSDGWLDFV